MSWKQKTWTLRTWFMDETLRSEVTISGVGMLVAKEMVQLEVEAALENGATRIELVRDDHGKSEPLPTPADSGKRTP